MKFAVSSTGKTLDSKVDPRFGRAPFFVIVDSDKGEIISVLDNSAAINAAHGAGINAAAKVAEAGVDAVLTGRVGPKAWAVLEQAGIKVVSDASGTVASAVKAQKNSPAQPDTAPTSDGHAPVNQGMGQGAGMGTGAGCRRTGGSGMGRGMGGGQGQGRGCGGGGRGRGGR